MHCACIPRLRFSKLTNPGMCRILCANRDEYLSRPTADAHFHSFEPIGHAEDPDGKVLSGRDLLAGGTWAGVNRSGRVALLYACVFHDDPDGNSIGL